jgi:hypothetical protein
MGGLMKRVYRLCFAGRALGLSATAVLAALLFAHTAPASPIASATRGAPVTLSGMMLQPIRDACGPSCPDCTDCVTEIDIAPAPYHGPYHKGDDPIGHAIKRLEPSPLLAGPDACPETGIEGHRGDPSGCGIRCWYWRLRYGYCGPGCEYYRYRLSRRDGPPEHFSPPRHHRACRS